MGLPAVPTIQASEILEQFEIYAICVIRLDTHFIEFEVAEITGWTEGDKIWTYDDGDNGWVTDFSQAEKQLSGSIKSDGCSNWDFHTDHCMAHFCGRKQATGIGRLINRLYDMAAERMVNFNHELDD